MTSRGEISRRTKRASWAFVFSLIVAAMTTFVAQPASAGDASEFDLVYQGHTQDVGASTTTYSWLLTGADATASHIIIGTCLGETAVATSPPGSTYVSTTNPGSTIVGYKWDSAATGVTYSLTFSGLLDESGTATTNVKNGSANNPLANKTRTTAGPPGDGCPAPEPGSLTVGKLAMPEDGTDFEFTWNEGDFSLDVDDDATLPDEVTFDGLVPGEYTVSEVVPEGWELVFAECGQFDEGQSEAAAFQAGATSAAARAAAVADEPDLSTHTFEIGPGEDWVCLFGNVGVASVTVRKDAQPNAADDFDFTVTDITFPEEPFEIDGFQLDDDADAALPNEATYEVLAGTYRVEEGAADGWTLAGLECDVLPAAIGERSVDLALDPGDHATCTFTNVVPAEAGSLTITKDVIGLPDADNLDDFTFTFHVDCSDDAFDDTVEITGEGSETIEGIPVGTTCVVTEDAVEEDGEGITWSATMTDDSGEADDGEVTIDADGETVDVVNERTQVLGNQLNRNTPVAGVQQLPATGDGTATLVALGSVLLALGALLVHGQRRLIKLPVRRDR